MSKRKKFKIYIETRVNSNSEDDHEFLGVYYADNFDEACLLALADNSIKYQLEDFQILDEVPMCGDLRMFSK